MIKTLLTKSQKSFAVILFLILLSTQFPSTVFADGYLPSITGDANLVSFWRMDESTGATAFVDSKNSYNATLSGGVTLGVASTYISGDSSTASTFDGTSGYASVGDIAAFDFTRTSPFTISAIIKPNVTRSGGATDYWVYTKMNPNSPFNGLMFGIRWNGSRTSPFVLFGANYPTQFIRLIGSQDLSNGTEYLISVTYDGSGSASGMKLYVDGNPISASDDGAVSGTIADGQNTTATGHAAELGRRGTLNKRFKGDIKDVAIFNVEQSSTWVQNLATAAGHGSHDNVVYTVNQNPRPQVFYDFDMDSDIDDVVDALTLLNLEHRGELDIVGAVSTSCHAKSAPTWIAIANYYGRGSIPTGVNTSSPGNGGCPSLYDTGVAATYGVAGKTDASQFENYIATQRRVLAASADNSIEYITTGDLSSVQGLLQSMADEYSDLTGVELVTQKIRHIWIVAGRWPSGAAVSDLGSNPVISNYVLTNWPTTVPMIFDSITDGDTVYSGQNVMEALPANNPARYAWELYFGNSNPSNKREAWSQIAMLPMARGLYPNSITGTDYSQLSGNAGTAVVNSSTGVTSWNNSVISNHSYLSKILSDANFTTAINALLLDSWPTTPGTPSATTPTNDNTPTWSWTVSTDTGDGLAATPYTVQWCGNSSFTGCDSNTSTSATNSFTHSVALADGTWYFRVKASDTLGNISNYSTAGSITIDATAPSSVGAPTFGTITSSSIEIVKPGTVTEGGTLNQWQARRNSATELGLNATTTTSVTDSSLSENTQYTYDAQFNDSAGNTSNYGTSAQKYTLSDTPTNLSASLNSNNITLTVDSFPNDTSGQSGYYFSRSGANSGWIQTNSWTDTGLSCGHEYTYSVKYRNGDGTDTSEISTTKSTSGCGGGGSPAIWTLPVLPAGGFKMSINGGASTTSNRNVFLGFNAGADIKKMAISMTGDFTDAIQEDYTPIKQWDLCSKLGGAIKNQTCPDGTYTVYAKFYIVYGRSSVAASVSSTITLKSTTTATENLQQPINNLPSSSLFTKYLQYRQSNSDIKRLQIFLNSDPDTRVADSGVGSSGHETNYFGILTYKAVIKFQEKYAKDVLAPWGFVKGTGYVGKTTLSKINELMGNK